MTIYGADWWDWYIHVPLGSRDVQIGRAYWSTSRAGRTRYVARFEVLTLGLDGVSE